MSKYKNLLATLISCGLLAACTTGPNYQRPNMELPESWLAKQGDAKQSETAGVRWWSVYADTALDRLEDEALAHNADAQVAVARVLETRALLGITEADQSPYLSANAKQSNTTSSGVGNAPPPAGASRNKNLSHLSLDASYELDLWGKFRRATEAGRADLLAVESARDAVYLTLTAQVAQQYFALLSLDAQESAVRRALTGREEKLALDKKRAVVGMLAEYDIHQSEAEAASARSQLATIIQLRNKQESTLALLLGRSPREVMNGCPSGVACNPP